jgi:hypothetical protein
VPTRQPEIVPSYLTTNCGRHLLAKVFAGLLLMSAISAEAGWTTAIKPDTLTHQPRCLLTSQPIPTSDGYESTPVSLVFNGINLLVVTESELDPSYNDLQLVVDDKPSIHSDKVVNKKILVFDQNVSELMKFLRAGRAHKVTVYLRFWPTWPATKSFPVSFSLIGFRKAHDALNQNCQPLAGSTRPVH